MTFRVVGELKPVVWMLTRVVDGVEHVYSTAERGDPGEDRLIVHGSELAARQALTPKLVADGWKVDVYFGEGTDKRCPVWLVMERGTGRVWTSDGWRRTDVGQPGGLNWHYSQEDAEHEARGLGSDRVQAVGYLRTAVEGGYQLERIK